MGQRRCSFPCDRPRYTAQQWSVPRPLESGATVVFLRLQSARLCSFWPWLTSGPFCLLRRLSHLFSMRLTIARKQTCHHHAVPWRKHRHHGVGPGPSSAPSTNGRAFLISAEGAFALDALRQNGLSVPYARKCLTFFSRLGCEEQLSPSSEDVANYHHCRCC